MRASLRRLRRMGASLRRLRRRCITSQTMMPQTIITSGEFLEMRSEAGPSVLGWDAAESALRSAAAASASLSDSVDSQGYATQLPLALLAMESAVHRLAEPIADPAVQPKVPAKAPAGSPAPPHVPGITPPAGYSGLWPPNSLDGLVRRVENGTGRAWWFHLSPADRAALSDDAATPRTHQSDPHPCAPTPYQEGLQTNQPYAGNAI